MLPALAEAFQYLADTGLVTFREALDELIWGESGILVLTTVREGDGACVVSFDHSEEEACIGQREWLRHDRGNSAGFFDAEEWTTMPRTEYPGKIRCVAVNRHVEAIEGEEEEKVQRCALGLRISGLPAPADVGAYVRGACQIPCGGSNAALRSLYANRLPCLAAWLKGWTEFDEIAFFREKEGDGGEAHKESHRFMTLRLPIAMEALAEKYPSLAQVLNK